MAKGKKLEAPEIYPRPDGKWGVCVFVSLFFPCPFLFSVFLQALFTFADLLIQQSQCQTSEKLT